MKQCQKCGYQNAENDAFCRGCGTSLDAEANNPGNNASSDNYSQPTGNYSQPNTNYSQPMNNYSQPGNFNHQPVPQNNNDAVMSLIFGIVSFFCCGIVFGPLAIWFGRKVLNQAKATPNVEYPGKGLATAGFITGIIGTALWAISLIFYAVVFIISLAGNM